MPGRSETSRHHLEDSDIGVSAEGRWGHVRASALEVSGCLQVVLLLQPSWRRSYTIITFPGEHEPLASVLGSRLLPLRSVCQIKVALRKYSFTKHLLCFTPFSLKLTRLTGLARTIKVISEIHEQKANIISGQRAEPWEQSPLASARTLIQAGSGVGFVSLCTVTTVIFIQAGMLLLSLLLMERSHDPVSGTHAGSQIGADPPAPARTTAAGILASDISLILLWFCSMEIINVSFKV